MTITAAPGARAGYASGAKTLHFVRLATCGCVTHWEPRAGRDGPRMGVNARLLAHGQLGDVRIRRLDGTGSEQYRD